MNHNLIFILILLFAIIIVIIFYKFKLWSQKSHTTAISIITASGVFFTVVVEAVSADGVVPGTITPGN